jgi:hypothetical protein
MGGDLKLAAGSCRPREITKERTCPGVAAHVPHLPPAVLGN